MFLKVNHNKKVKKLKFSEELHQYDKFLDTIKDITGFATSDIQMVFVDNEGENLSINDRLDFDYFLADISESKFKEIFVEEKVKAEKVVELEPVKINIEEELNVERENDFALFEAEHFSPQIESHVFSTPIEFVETQPFLNAIKLSAHPHVSCDVCHQIGIVGKRYKCLLCKNFDICETCESQNKHPYHPMIRCTDDINERITEKICSKFAKMTKRGEKLENVKKVFKGKCLKKLLKHTVEPLLKFSTSCGVKEEEKVSSSFQEKSALQKEIQKFQSEKKELLKFMFGDDQPELVDTLFKTYESLNIEQMVNEIMKSEHANYQV